MSLKRSKINLYSNDTEMKFSIVQEETECVMSFPNKWKLQTVIDGTDYVIDDMVTLILNQQAKISILENIISILTGTEINPDTLIHINNENPFSNLSTVVTSSLVSVDSRFTTADNIISNLSTVVTNSLVSVDSRFSNDYQGLLSTISSLSTSVTNSLSNSPVTVQTLSIGYNGSIFSEMRKFSITLFNVRLNQFQSTSSTLSYPVAFSSPPTIVGSADNPFIVSFSDITTTSYTIYITNIGPTKIEPVNVNCNLLMYI
jgi:hypothetical protein